MKFKLASTLIISASYALAGNYSTWQEHSQAFLASQDNLNNKSAGSVVVTVGSGTSCDFRTGATKIQNALDSGADVIRIVSETYDENLEIDDFSVSLIGGYANCDDAENDVNNGSQAIIDGGNNTSVLYITGDNQNHLININNIRFTNGRGGDFPSGGGISVQNADLELNLNNVLLDNNDGGSGGGLHISNGSTSVNAIDVLVINNTAGQGGGIYCSGNQNSILMSNTGEVAGVVLNDADSLDGGGALLVNGCGMTSYMGSTGGLLGFRGFAGNNANENGGGIAVKSGSRLTLLGDQFCLPFFPFSCVGNNEFAVEILNNNADSDDNNSGNGGGIYATGAGTVVDALTIDINGNQAYHGGGVAVEDGAVFNTSYSTADCWSPGSCNQIRNNSAERFGGGVYTEENDVVNISVSHLQGNRANLGTAIYIFNDAIMNISSSIITGNGDQGADGFNDIYAIRINEPTGTTAELNIQSTTIADNNLESASIGNNQGRVTLLSTIIHDPASGDAFESVNPVLEVSSCVMAHEIMTVPTGFDVIEDDPEFVDRLNGDFHLNAMTSPAIDICSINLADPALTDIELETRGWDDPNASNINGPYDIGADESYGGDVIFADGFEN